jgi:hypothetical protein
MLLAVRNTVLLVAVKRADCAVTAHLGLNRSRPSSTSKYRPDLRATLLLALCSIGLIHCRGDNGVPFDVLRADAIAHHALPQKSEVPGTDWLLLETDQFESPSLLNTGACERANDTDDDLRTRLQPAIAGRAKETFLKSERAVDTVTLDYFVTIFRPDSDLKESIRRRRDYVSAPDYLDCVISNGSGLDTHFVRPSGRLRDDGYVVAYEDPRLPFRRESYAWRFRNSIVLLDVEGDPAAVKALDVQAVIDGFDKKLHEASNIKKEQAPAVGTPHT